MYCFKCGAQIPENSKFCPECGAPINYEVPEKKNDFTLNASKLEPAKGNNGKVALLATAAVVLVLIAAIIAIVGGFSKKDNNGTDVPDDNQTNITENVNSNDPSVTGEYGRYLLNFVYDGYYICSNNDNEFDYMYLTIVDESKCLIEYGTHPDQGHSGEYKCTSADNKTFYFMFKEDGTATWKLIMTIDGTEGDENTYRKYSAEDVDGTGLVIYGTINNSDYYWSDEYYLYNN